MSAKSSDILGEMGLVLWQGVGTWFPHDLKKAVGGLCPLDLECCVFGAWVCFFFSYVFFTVFWFSFCFCAAVVVLAQVRSIIVKVLRSEGVCFKRLVARCRAELSVRVCVCVCVAALVCRAERSADLQQQRALERSERAAVLHCARAAAART